MRLTGTLLRGHGRVVRLFKEKWKSVKRKRVPEVPFPEAIQLKAVDVSLVVNPVKALPIIPVPEPYNTVEYDKDPKNFKDEVCLVFVNDARLLEGLKQAQIITNTIVKNGLPPHIEKLLGKGEHENQDEMVKRSILLSHIYDGFQARLPKIIDLKRPSWIIRRGFGIPEKRKIELLVRNLLRTMELQTKSYEGLMGRMNFLDAKSVVTTRKDNDLLQFNVKANIMVTSNAPLPPLAGPEEVASLRNAALPDIYPMNHTVDFIKTNVYEHTDFFQLKNSFGGNVHTIYLYDVQPEKKWSSSQRLARALICSYAFAVAQFKNRNLIEKKPLHRPVVVQCVQSTGQKFSFISFQLNTLDNSLQSSERNLAWIQPDVPIYDICTGKEGKVYFEGYNSDVYENLLAMHMNGMTNSSDQPSFSDLLRMYNRYEPISNVRPN